MKTTILISIAVAMAMSSAARAQDIPDIEHPPLIEAAAVALVGLPPGWMTIRHRSAEGHFDGMDVVSFRQPSLFGTTTPFDVNGYWTKGYSGGYPINTTFFQPSEDNPCKFALRQSTPPFATEMWDLTKLKDRFTSYPYPGFLTLYGDNINCVGEDVGGGDYHNIWCKNSYESQNMAYVSDMYIRRVRALYYITANFCPAIHEPERPY